MTLPSCLSPRLASSLMREARDEAIQELVAAVADVSTAWRRLDEEALASARARMLMANARIEYCERWLHEISEVANANH